MSTLKDSTSAVVTVERYLPLLSQQLFGSYDALFGEQLFFYNSVLLSLIPKVLIKLASHNLS